MGPEGGIAGQYLGLKTLFGPERIAVTPIPVSMIMSAAMGCVLLGMHLVAEMRFAEHESGTHPPGLTARPGPVLQAVRGPVPGPSGGHGRCGWQDASVVKSDWIQHE